LTNEFQVQSSRFKVQRKKSREKWKTKNVIPVQTGIQKNVILSLSLSRAKNLIMDFDLSF